MITIISKCLIDERRMVNPDICHTIGGCLFRKERIS